MATIQAHIQLKDGMSPALRAIEKTLANVVATFSKLETVLNRSLGTGKIDAANRQLGTTQQKVNKIEQEVHQATAAERRFQSEVTKTLGAIYKQQTNQVRLTAAIRKTPPAIQQAANAQEKLNNKINKGAGLMSGFVGKVVALAGAYMGLQTVKGVIGIADELTMTTARLNLMNDGLQTTAELEDKIYQAAMRSRGSFMGMTDAVAKLGNRAKNVFKTNDETIAFTETLNKMFVIAGAGQAEISSATLQLTQALGAGVLRGEEFNAIFEAAPNIIQAVADYMNVPVGKMKELASEGKISANIVKNALFAASSEVNKQFEQIPYTWGQVWTTIKNYTLKATRPILQAISNITKSERFIRFANGAGKAISKISAFFQRVGKIVMPILGAIFDAVAWVFNVISSNWSLIAPIVYGVAAAFLALKAPLIAAAIWTGIVTVATKLWTAAQAIFNAVMSANPVTLVVLAVIALVTVFYLAIAAVNKFCGTSISATGLVAGAFGFLWARVYNVFALMWNVVSAFVEFFANVFKHPTYSVKLLFVNLGLAMVGIMKAAAGTIDAVANAIVDAIEWAVNKAIDAVNSLISMLPNKAKEFLGVSKIGRVNMGEVSFTSTVSGWEDKLNAFKGEAPEGYTSMKKLEYKDLGDTAKAWYEKGAKIDDTLGLSFDKIKDMVTGGNGDIAKALSGELGGNELLDELGKLGKDSPLLDEIAKNTGDIAKDTGNISGKLSVSDEEMNYVRKLAQRETINKYTRSHVNLHMTNNNQIRNGMDVNEMSRAIARQIQTELSYSAEGIRL